MQIDRAIDVIFRIALYLFLRKKKIPDQNWPGFCFFGGLKFDFRDFIWGRGVSMSTPGKFKHRG